MIAFNFGENWFGRLRLALARWIIGRLPYVVERRAYVVTAVASSEIIMPGQWSAPPDVRAKYGDDMLSKLNGGGDPV